MILVDTSVWIDHFRRGDASLTHVLQTGLVLCHPFVIGELACGHLRQRTRVLGAMDVLPSAPVATRREALVFVERHALAGRGIGWVDAHLLASTVLAGGAKLWTRDKRLAGIAADLGLAWHAKQS